MVKIRISTHHKDIQNIDIKGHAMAGEYGQDVVCAGISSIVFGAMNALDTLFPEFCDFTVDDDRIGIYVKRSSDSLQLVLRAVVLQLKTIEESYSDKLKFTRKEV
ncbi:ribosomal-processing cysteine protease Prp [Dubosiella muris]|uniref:Ribosomal-processing cysteine protease Prp n=1 Tax=Dubosiella muris TaxID=3038133 RepID=A0AC61R8C7_9FIRM|nr:ribosomal-processing cysteine protease Prp [Dubosiella muris]TGY65843.1 ribosomal-processing cysteine protease Prp [Dubosiella muris]